jgi:hypothetical protein
MLEKSSRKIGENVFGVNSKVNRAAIAKLSLYGFQLMKTGWGGGIVAQSN